MDFWDFANFVQAKENTWEAYQLLKEYIVYFHVKDAKMSDDSVVPAIVVFFLWSRICLIFMDLQNWKKKE